MSVVKAILFYSKRDKKSLTMKSVADKVGADLDYVSVDAQEIRERLLDDEKYFITQVPAVLVLYSNGNHKTYIGTQLDKWFAQLLQNIQNYALMQEQELMQSSTPIDDGLPKSLRRKPSVQNYKIPERLSSPGRARIGTTYLDESSMSGGIGGDTGFTSAMKSEHIRDAEPMIPIDSDPMIQPGRKEVKSEDISPHDLAKQIADQRAQVDEEIDNNRPFL
jgi:hypothetical protein